MVTIQPADGPGQDSAGVLDCEHILGEGRASGVANEDDTPS